MTAETKPEPTIDQRIGQYVKLRDKIKMLDDQHKANMKPYREALDSLNSVLLDKLNATGGDSLKTKNGTAYKSVKRTASLEDADVFMEYVIANAAFDLMDRKVNVTAAETFANEHGKLPPGVKMSSTATVNVRRPT